MINFEGYDFTDGGVCAPRGFVAGAAAAGIKTSLDNLPLNTADVGGSPLKSADSNGLPLKSASGGSPLKNDIAVIYALRPCVAAAVYTQNKVKGAPIIVTERHLKDSKAQAIVANSGNANTCNANGIEIAEKVCEITAAELNIKKEDVIVASTGVIGQPLTMTPFEEHLPALCASLTEFGSLEACSAIMTTDTTKKQAAVEFTLNGKPCRIGGIAKGSGMINPNMATMLCFITTDVSINDEMLKLALSEAANVTFNRVCVDGDTSTNDMATIMASGAAGNVEIISENEDYEVFFGGLYAVMTNLAREMARDGEGATKLIECLVVNAPDTLTAHVISKSVISSSLVKTAIFAADANWGRILCAIGYADAQFDIDKVSVDLISQAGRIRVCENGSGIEFSEGKAHNILLEDEITIYIDVNSQGEGEAVAWGCDLSYDYIKINAEYRT